MTTAAGSEPAPADAVRGLVGTVVDTVAQAGTITASGIAEALEGASRSFCRRVVQGAAGRDGGSARGLAGRDDLARALAEAPRPPALSRATTAGLALKLAGRFRPLGFLARRTPAFLLATLVPTLGSSVTHGAHEVGTVSSHLVQRARAQGVEPDLERVRRVAVQLVSNRPVDPEVEPRHGALTVRWLGRAGRAALPFGAGVATADPQTLASAAASVDVSTLGAA